MVKLRAYVKPGDWILFFLLLMPLIVAWPRLAPLLTPNVSSWLTVLGRGAGILGLSMMLLAGLLSIRLPNVDRPFGGLPRLWYIHHVLGFGGFLLVMIHVLSLAFAVLPASVHVAVVTIFPPLSSVAIWMGWLSFIALAIFLAPSFKFFGQPHYQRWKLIHLMSAPALVFALAHALPISSDKHIWWILAVLGIGAIVWRKLLAPRAARRSYIISAVEKLAGDVVELTLTPEGTPIGYEAGQFVYLTPTDPKLKAGKNEEHPYTISSAPHESVMRIGIKAFGDATEAIQTINPQTRVWIEGPYGHFFERLYPERGQLWLGGGIGITPFVGGVRALRQQGFAPKEGVHLFHLANDAKKAYYLHELKTAATEIPHLRVTEHFFHQEGPMSAEFLARHCPDFAEREIYICGPPGMIEHLDKVLRGAGVPRSRVHKEAFNFL